VIEREREELPRPWSVRQLETLAKVSRPLRRRIVPNRFKETYVNRALARRNRATLYVEIGVRDGESFRLARADTRIGIDPERWPTMARLEPGERFFEVTSDEFFDLQAEAVLEESSVDVALLDGLHEFRQVLRDFDNLERFMRPDGVVIVDDCNPQSAERASDVPIGGAWNGDVWKLAAYLVAERPDLDVTTIDADQGVGVITGFGRPKPAIDEATIENYKSLPYVHLEASRSRILNLRPPSSFDSLLP
jgi:Methyltransferase domain